MIRLQFVPPSFTISHIISLLKGKSLDPTNPSNYRGISISSTFSKIFEAIVLDIASVSLSQSLHSLQGGFRKGYSTSHTSFIVQEAIFFLVEKTIKNASLLFWMRKRRLTQFGTLVYSSLWPSW